MSFEERHATQIQHLTTVQNRLQVCKRLSWVASSFLPSINFTTLSCNSEKKESEKLAQLTQKTGRNDIETRPSEATAGRSVAGLDRTVPSTCRSRGRGRRKPPSLPAGPRSVRSRVPSHAWLSPLCRAAPLLSGGLNWGESSPPSRWIVV